MTMDEMNIKIIRKWAKQLGYSVTDGKEPNSIILKGGPIAPGVLCKDNVVLISCGLAVEDKSSFQKPEKLLHLLVGRMAFVFLPPPPKEPEELLIYQRMSIAPGQNSDTASFNRFSDAVQEVINATILTARVLNGAKFSMVPSSQGMYQ